MKSIFIFVFIFFRLTLFAQELTFLNLPIKTKLIFTRDISLNSPGFLVISAKNIDYVTDSTQEIQTSACVLDIHSHPVAVLTGTYLVIGREPETFSPLLHESAHLVLLGENGHEMKIFCRINSDVNSASLSAAANLLEPILRIELVK